MMTPVHLFTTMAMLLAPVRTQDTGGGMVQQWQEAGAFRCRLRTLALAEMQAIQGDRTRYDYVMYCGPAVAVDETKRVRVNGEDYQVMGVNDYDALGTLKAVRLKRTA